MNRDVAQFYYTEKLPAKAVQIARVISKPSTPEDLTDINNIPQTETVTQAGSLLIKTYPVTHVSDAVIPGNAVRVPASPETPNYKVFIVENQFFEITDTVDSNGVPLFYRHLLPDGVRDITVVDANGGTVNGPMLITPGALYHALDGGLYTIRYYDQRNLKIELLKYTPVYMEASSPSAFAYQYQSGVIFMIDAKPYWVRFLKENEYSILPPYNTLPNEPWHLRVRSNIRPLAPEWGRQLFAPYRPYMLATWVPAEILSEDVIEFERKPILFDGLRYPDVLVFDKDYNLKFALDGSPVNTAPRRGYLYPWTRAQVHEIDTSKGRLKLAVELDPTDKVFGFFYYAEYDILYRDLDVNPFTNPSLKNRVIEIIYNPQEGNYTGEDPFKFLYHRVFREGSNTVYDLELSNTNQIATGEVIGTFTVGASLSLNEFITTDDRTQGGGLDQQYHNLPIASSMWDLGRWDGTPFPVGASAVVYLPKTLLLPNGQFTKEEARSLVGSLVPMGTVPVVRFYDENGEEEV